MYYSANGVSVHILEQIHEDITTHPTQQITLISHLLPTLYYGKLFVVIKAFPFVLLVSRFGQLLTHLMYVEEQNILSFHALKLS